MRNARIFAVLAAVLYLSGCASGAKMGNMVYEGPVNTYDTALQSNVNVANVSGGEDTNPAWTSEIDNDAFAGALKQSLRKQGLLSGDGRYQLEALLLEVDQPMFGLDFKVTTHVKYILTDRKNNGAVVLNETVVAPYTATVGDAFVAIKRLRLANEGSGKANIQSLLEKLSELKIQPGDISLNQ
ncbi:hypothetical protein MSNKSG1_10463 [Marinobacter santoriniensis NKSG1]|uniref:Lipoprotein n=1 Tax=Marinobacter santoriniensis NKSG1 TaxID=1288826 RepID=M7CVQ8_9GAMM|nr:hypothetical protein [Marinobacter santoriniensis]EMP56290.1 hypothetical protein MSNKSG1_10463 [Marinobacter santoriniensis NKSG1]